MLVMNTEIVQITQQLKDVYEGEPWFGRSVKSLLNDAKPNVSFEKPNDQHSILELLWHMITWREFTIKSLRNDDEKNPQYFEDNDWRKLDHNDSSLWEKGLQKLDETQSELIESLQHQVDKRLNEIVPGKKYNFKSLLYGIIHHDIYHIGQIAYVIKLLQNK